MLFSFSARVYRSSSSSYLLLSFKDLGFLKTPFSIRKRLTQFLVSYTKTSLHNLFLDQFRPIFIVFFAKMRSGNPYQAGEANEKEASETSSVEQELNTFEERIDTRINGLEEKMDQMMKIMLLGQRNVKQEPQALFESESESSIADAEFKTPHNEATIKEEVVQRKQMKTDSNIVYISRQVIDYNGELNCNDMNVYGIYKFLKRIKEFDRAHEVTINIHSKINATVLIGYLGINKDHTEIGNEEMTAKLYAYLKPMLQSNDIAMRFLVSPTASAITTSKIQGNNDNVIIINLAVALLREMTEAYIWYADIVGHKPNQNIFNSEVFPLVTGGYKTQRVSELFIRRLTDDNAFKRLLTDDLQNLVKSHNRVDFMVCSTSMIVYLESQIEPMRQAQHLAARFSYILLPKSSHGSRPDKSYGYSRDNKGNGYVDKNDSANNQKNHGYKNTENVNKNKNFGYNGNKEVNEVQVDEPDDQDEINEDEDIQVSDDDISVDSVNTIAVDNLEASEKPCTSTVRTGTCNVKGCIYDHPKAKILHEYSRYSYVINAMITSQRKLNPDHPFQLKRDK